MDFETFDKLVPKINKQLARWVKKIEESDARGKGGFKKYKLGSKRNDYLQAFMRKFKSSTPRKREEMFLYFFIGYECGIVNEGYSEELFTDIGHGPAKKPLSLCRKQPMEDGRMVNVVARE
jgi:hypothetical protein